MKKEPNKIFAKKSSFRINSTDIINIKLFSVASNCDPMDYRLPGSSVCGVSQVRIQEWVAFPSLGDLSNPRIETGPPALAGRLFTTELPRKPRHILRNL